MNDDIWDKIAVDIHTNIPDDIINDIQNNNISNDIIWDLIVNNCLPHNYDNFSYQLDMKVYRIRVYHNRENEIMYTHEFRQYESLYCRVKHQIKSSYRYYQIEKQNIKELASINFIDKSYGKKEILEILSRLTSFEQTRKDNYDTAIKTYIKKFNILPKITTNIQKSKNNVRFLEDF